MHCCIDPWDSDASSSGSCSETLEDFEDHSTVIPPVDHYLMAFPARMSQVPVIEGRVQDIMTANQVSDPPSLRPNLLFSGEIAK